MLHRADFYFHRSTPFLTRFSKLPREKQKAVLKSIVEQSGGRWQISEDDARYDKQHQLWIIPCRIESAIKPRIQDECRLFLFALHIALDELLLPWPQQAKRATKRAIQRQRDTDAREAAEAKRRRQLNAAAAKRRREREAEKAISATIKNPPAA